ncbi:MAG: CapA family protein [Gammaproteobacteria bacterium]|nr:CapA family protein [Gammaproteobacteria bacterium]
MLIPPGSDGRIPVAAIASTGGGRRAAAILAHMMMLSGRTVGVAMRTGAFVAGQQAGNKGVTSAAAARMVLSDPAVEIAILETRFDEIVQTGVGCDVFSVCAMLDARNRPAQLPDDETYAGLLDRFVTAARDSVVLNADDAKCRQMAKSHPSIRFWYVTENSDNAFVREHVQNGGPACIAQTVEGELSLALYIDGELALAVPAKDIPINASQNERRRIIRQALYATALASCLGADIAGIELGLKTLSHGVLSEPLRAQIVNGPACKLLAGEFREAKVGRHLANILSAMARKDKSIIALLDTDRGVGDTNTGFGLGSPADIDLYVCRDKETKDRLAAAGVSRHRINVAVDEAGVIAHALSAAAPIDIVGVLCDDLDRALQRIDCFRESVIDARNGKPAQLSTDSQTADTEPPLARLTRAAGHSMRTKAVEPAGSLGAAMASEGADTVRSEGQATPAPSQSQAPVATSPASKAEGDKEPLWALPELQTIMGGKWLKRPPEGAVGTGANYYAGQVEPGDVAFTTEPIAWQSSKYRNTNEAIPTLFANGAAAVVASQISAKYEGDQPVLLVDDTRLALDLFGKAARDRLTGKVIAVTGSAGKTTTKEFTHFLLSRQGKTKSSRKNYNHGPGVPLMLAETPPDVRFGVYEFAVDMPKVTAKKAQILRPHVAVITNIYADHLHLYKTLENLADQKCLLFEGLEPGGTTVLNRDSPLFQRLLDNAQKKGVVNVLTFGEAPESQFRLLNAELSVDGSHAVASILDERVEFEVPQPGAYMIMNCLAALAALHAAGGDWRKAVNDVVDLPRLGQRNERYILTFDDGTGELIDDTFSANPASAEAGLSVLKMMRPSPGGRRIAVMGEIKELGENSPKFHAGLAPAVKDAGVDILFTIGADIKPLRDALGPDIPGQHSEDPRAIAVAVAQTLGPGDIVWVKGSRRTPAQLEHIIDTIMDAARETRVLAPSAPDTAASTPRSARAVTEPPPAQPMDAVPTTNYAGPKSPRLLKSGKNGARLEILFLGDTGFGENYQESREARGVENILKTRGYDAPLAELSNLLHSADLVVANLETPVTDLKVSPFAGKKSWVHWADTEKTPTHLLANNIKVVGLANNHTFDYGAAGFDQTLAVLKERGLTAFGAGADLEAAGRPFVIKADMAGRPFELAVIATFETPARKEASHHAYATNRRGGLNPLDATTIGRSIDEVKNALPDALVMVFPHWGQNYKWCTKRQTHLAGELLSAGADVIVGHGAHMVQEIEKQGDRWVVYSLGNFMFNSAGRYAQFNAPPYSLVARLAIEPKGDGMAKRLQLLPIVTDNRITDFRPRPATEAEFDELTTLLKQRFPTPDTFDDMVQRGCDATGHFYLELSL